MTAYAFVSWVLCLATSILLGMVFLLDQAFYWFDFDYIWPLLLIGIGVMLLYRATAPKKEEQTATTVAQKNLEVGNGSS